MKKSLSIAVSSTINSPALLQRAKSLAARLNLPYLPSIIERDYDVLLLYTENGLRLVQPTATNNLKILLYIDFVRGKNGYRRSKDLTIRQPLAKAIGIKSGFRPSVLDATAGLGRDAFVLACLGCYVSLCERSPVLHALLEDGLGRAVQEEDTAEIVSTRMNLVFEDSMDYLRNSPRKFHTVYLDPMYPHRTNSALNKQEMRVVRDLVGDDEDGGALLEPAFAAAQNRVVVKRPKGAKQLSGRKPSYSASMKNSRYDIYLTSVNVAGGSSREFL